MVKPYGGFDMSGIETMEMIMGFRRHDVTYPLVKTLIHIVYKMSASCMTCGANYVKKHENRKSIEGYMVCLME